MTAEEKKGAEEEVKMGKMGRWTEQVAERDGCKSKIGGGRGEK